MSEAFWIVLGMAAVTYLPRMLPFFWRPAAYSPFVRRFLKYLPFAILGALIFPGVLTSTGSPASSVAGAAVAVLFAWWRWHLILVVLGAVLAATLVGAIGG
ncbi:MAG: AzlD domain-containing protein [Hydrogenibacillus sp.]|nr:AzlD domain-containing protein [Hydrogenibacillus sp.]